jgi:hypothetical protein
MGGGLAFLAVSVQSQGCLGVVIDAVFFKKIEQTLDIYVTLSFSQL